MVKSKFSGMVYGYSLLMTAFIGLGVYFCLHPAMQFKNKFGNTNSALLPGLILIFGMGGILVFCLRYVFYFRTDADAIFLWSIWSRRMLARSEIARIKPLNSADDVTILSTDGRSYTLNYDVYRNMPVLKRYLRDNYGNLVEALPRPARPAAESTRDILDDEPISAFSGNFLTSQYALYSIFMLGLLLWGLYTLRNQLYAYPLALLPVFVPYSMFYIVFGRQLYFFRMAGDYLEINNYLFFWFRRVYRLEEIDCVLVTRPSRQSTTLRVRTKEFESKGYAADSLRKKDWRDFQKALQARQVFVIGGVPMRSADR